jgi:hypothetical protein
MAEGDPTGPDLATSTRNLSLGSKAVYRFTFDVPYAVTVGTPYAIVVRRPGATVDDAAEWFYKAGQTGTGEAKQSVDGGSSWSSVGVGNDFYLVTYSAGPTIEDNWSFVTPDGDINIRSAVWAAQTFQPSSSYPMTAVDIQLEDNNLFSDPDEPEDIVVSLKAVEGAAAPSKASNPSPANASGPGIDFDPPTLSWTGDGDTYDVYAGAAGNWVKIADGISETTYTLSAADKLVCRNGVVTWRVDSINEADITQGDDWTFDPRPAKVANPVPTDTDTGISINTTLAWDASAYATGYDVWVGSTKAVSDTDQVSVIPVAVLPLVWGTEYTWRVDPRNEYGATTGDDWTFTTLVFDPPRTFARYLSDNTIVAAGTAFDPDTMYATGENGMGALRRLILFCGSSLWYDSIDDTN